MKFIDPVPQPEKTDFNENLKDLPREINGTEADRVSTEFTRGAKKENLQVSGKKPIFKNKSLNDLMQANLDKEG